MPQNAVLYYAAVFYGAARADYHRSLKVNALADVAAFVEKARWAGTPVQLELWEGMFHCWQVFARDVPEARRAIGHIGSFVQDALSR